jgi:sugar phosphate isomerase/epimerase
MMERRTFITSMAAAVVGWRARPLLEARLPIAFSTLGCPEWDWLTVIDFAAEHGFAGIELRGIQAAMDLTTRPEFGAARLAQTRKQLADRELRIVGIGSSANLHEPDPAIRKTGLDEARRFIDLAQALDAPFVRVFPNRYVDGEAHEVTIERIAQGLRELGEHARNKNVTVLLESHGDMTDSPTLLKIMQLANSPRVALLWDAHHTFAFSREAPDDTYRQLRQHIRHTHLKDSVPDGSGGRKYVLTGSGEVPVKRQVEVLKAGGYTGMYCLEWEKRWHPEIEAPEVAFPHYARMISEYLR